MLDSVVEIEIEIFRLPKTTQDGVVGPIYTNIIKHKESVLKLIQTRVDQYWSK